MMIDLRRQVVRVVCLMNSNILTTIHINLFSPPSDNDDAEEDNQGEECETCGRKFNIESYSRHIKICKKVFVNKRKAFNAKNKRVIDSDHAQILKNAELEEKKKAKLNKGKNDLGEGKETKKEPKWKKQSEAFRNVLQNARIEEGGANTDQRGNVIVPQKITSDYDDYTHCGICNRKYNEEAYKKHLGLCQRKQKEMMLKGKKQMIECGVRVYSE